MGKRLTRIATRTGDDGTTGLADGARVAKSHRRVTAMGDVDELNSQLGVLLTEPLPDDVRARFGIRREKVTEQDDTTASTVTGVGHRSIGAATVTAIYDLLGGGGRDLSEDPPGPGHQPIQHRWREERKRRGGSARSRACSEAMGPAVGAPNPGLSHGPRDARLY